ncbi:MAG: signal peptidase II [Oscillospiraceae bacterium]|jgi:signal peptidase II|nr:signal peptidase II [Oscillospiraceae bacterium]
MLCFVFSFLVILLDQLFKRWITLTLAVGEHKALIPGIITLTRVENTGAAFSILSDKRWLLAIVMFVCVVVLIAILLRYNEGFWGTLGLAAVLGGAVGNLIDRVFHGHVVDMFELQFMKFAIFNVADIFITLGGITFCVFFILSSIRSSKNKGGALRLPLRVPDAEMETPADFDIITAKGLRDRAPDADVITVREQAQVENKPPIPAPSPPMNESDLLDGLGRLESDLSEDALLEEYDLDKMLRNYGFEDDKNYSRKRRGTVGYVPRLQFGRVDKERRAKAHRSRARDA